jgi:hypothetical protein
MLTEMVPDPAVPTPSAKGSKMNSWKKMGFVLIVVALILSWQIASRQPKEGAGKEFPASWKVNEILVALTNEEHSAYADLRDSNPSAQVLTWKIEEDDRPWYLEECILWVHYLDRSGRKHWILTDVGRNPKPSPEGWGRGWELPTVYDAPIPNFQVFDHAPTNQDVYDFLLAANWEFRPRHRFRILDAGVCVETWRKVIGEWPTKFFGS